MQNITKAIATGLYSGYAPFASGTVGSAVCLALWFIPAICHSQPPQVALFAAIVFVLIAGTLATHHHIQTLISHGAAPESLLDPKFVVIDEFAGMLIALLAVDRYSILLAMGAFLLFRVFDVLKPWPISALERLPGAIGIMADDVAAGVAAYFSLILILYAL